MKMNSFKKRIRTMLSKRLCRCVHDPVHAELRCAVEKCTTLYGFGLSGRDWHFLASTMRQYIQSPGIPLEETHLWSYFQKFHPRDMREALFGKLPWDDASAGVLAQYRDPQRGPMPWTTEADIRKEAHKATYRGDYGPWPKEDVADRFDRIKQVCHAIQSYGYDPSRAAHEEDTIRGVLLKRGDDWRMVILGGNHRSCALAALGHTHIPVRADRGLPPMIDLENSSQWPCVREGALPQDVALKIANFYFENPGNRKASAWGIIPG